MTTPAAMLADPIVGASVEPTRRDARRNLIAIAVLVLAISVLHYGTQTTLPVLHDVYRRLYYIPVGLGAIWFGVRGGLWVSVVIASLYMPHILMDWNDEGREVANQFMEIGLYFVFSWLVGYFSEKERGMRIRCQEAAERLDRSYRQLRAQADQMLEIEEQLRRADRLSAIGQLAAALTHEIRNPLGGIKGTAEILRDEFPPGHPKAEFLEILLKETDRLNGVVENFLGYARPQAAGGPTDTADLGAVVKETASLLSAQASKRRVELDARVPRGVLVRGSELQLKQVLLNLLLNAVQASRAGRVAVRWEIRDGKVRGAEYREVEGRLVALIVEDDGPGITEGLLERIFEPFYTTKAEGTGLGLAISQGIARAHGGSIEAENRPEGGARFILTLPLLQDQTAETHDG